MSLKGTAIPTTGTEILELQPFLKYLADCIRTKKETTEPINAQDFGKEILKISGGANLNIAYGKTPPSDTSKLWLNCQEPSGVEIQNYLGECAVSNVLEYGTIGNPTTSSYFYGDYFSTCYIGNNQIAIVGYNHIRIFDLTTKSYIADYSISGVGGSSKYSNVIYKDNVLYLVYDYYLYSYDLSTQTLIQLYKQPSQYRIYYIAFYSDTEIDLYMKTGNYNGVYRYNTTTQTVTNLLNLNSYGSHFSDISKHTVKANDTLYNFTYYSAWKYVDNATNVVTFTSFTNFIENTLGTTSFTYTSAIYDCSRYIYLIGGGNTTIGFDNLIKYDTVNDTFELLDTKLLSGKYSALSVLVDNRVYMFGGYISTSDYYGRPNNLDYFDLQYPLNENNAIVTINNSTDNIVTLINEDTIKLKSNVASAYIGNADNLAEKVNAYYYKITGQEPKGYTSLIFDKNAILENYSTLIEMAESNNMGILSFPFKNLEKIVYVLGLTYLSSNDSLEIIIIDEDSNILFSTSINGNGDFNSTSTYGDCIWVEGDTYTFEFGEYLEFSNEIEGETLTHTMDDFALMGTAIGKNGGVLGKWLGINTKDPFEWGTVEEQNLFLGETKTFEVSYTNNLNWEMTYDVTSDLEVTNNHTNVLTINAGSTVGTYPIIVTANSSEYNSVYEKTFNVITNNAITWSTIPNQTSTSSNSITLDLSTYYTNNSSYDVTLSASSSDNSNFEVSITGNTLTVNCLAVANTTITIEAIVLGITYSVSFNLTAS